MSILHSNYKLHAVYFTENEEHEPRKKTKSKLIFTILFFIKSIMKKIGISHSVPWQINELCNLLLFFTGVAAFTRIRTWPNGRRGPWAMKDATAEPCLRPDWAATITIASPLWRTLLPLHLPRRLQTRWWAGARQDLWRIWAWVVVVGVVVNWIPHFHQQVGSNVCSAQKLIVF